VSDYIGNIALAATGTYRLEAWGLSTSSAKDITALVPLGGDHVAVSDPSFVGESAMFVTVLVVGSSVSDLTSKMNVLRAEANQPRNTYLHAPGGSGSLVAFTVLECDRQEVDEAQSYGLAYHQTITLSLRVAPFAQGALQTIHSAVTVNAPDSLSLATLYGDLPVPLRVYADDASTYDIHSFYMALAPRALTDAKWIIDESQWSWSGDSTTTGINEYSAAVQREDSTTADAGTLDVSGYPAGLYRLVARVCVAAGYGYIRTNLAGADTDVTITNTTLALVELGDVWLPPSATKSGTASNLIVYLAGDNAHYAYFDYLLALPLWLGFLSVHPSTTTQEFDEIDAGPSGLFIDGVTDWTDVVGDILRPRTTAMLCPELITTHTPTGDTWPTDWTRSDDTDVTATSDLFQVVSDAAAVRSAHCGSKVVTAKEWYEVTLSKQVTAYASAAATVVLRWYDVSEALLSAATLATYAATDVAPVAVAYYAQAPVDAAYGRLYVETAAANSTTIQFSAAYLHRCPLNLLIAAEDAAASDADGQHDLAVTVQATPRYEGAR